MNVLEVPFVKLVGIDKTPEGHLLLNYGVSLHNHLQTMHASAQFALAETASGETLQRMFPELVGKVIPVLRESQVKFRKPAVKNIIAHASVSDEASARFKQQFASKGRALIAVDVELRDIDNLVTCSATYTWYIQGIEAVA